MMGGYLVKKIKVTCSTCNTQFELTKKVRVLAGEGHNRRPLKIRGDRQVIKCPHCGAQFNVNARRF